MSSINDESGSGNGEVFEQFVEAVSHSALGSLLPPSLCQFLVGLRGGCSMYWAKTGDDVVLTNQGRTARQTKSSRSVLANVALKQNTGAYSWRIRVDNITRSGCKYIGVVNQEGVQTANLNKNLQSGCSGKRIAWDGSCARIYHDIDDYAYGSTSIGKKYATGDIVTVQVDTDQKIVSFQLNDEAIEQCYQYKGAYELVPVIGFGYETDTEQYTLLDCSWWGKQI